jgi:hypothetical protein
VDEPSIEGLAVPLAAVEAVLGIVPGQPHTGPTLAGLDARLTRVETGLARLTATVDRIEAGQVELRHDVTDVQITLGGIGGQLTQILDLLRNR